MKLVSYDAVKDHMADIAQDKLVRIVYVSEITKSLKRDNTVFKHIQHHASDYNKENNIKGFLCNSSRYFLQCLEGRKKALLPLLSRLFKDRRHKKMHVVLIEPIQRYSFTDWCMRSLFLGSDTKPNVTDKNGKPLESYPVRFAEFMPFEPGGWPTWMFEHFTNTMQEFDSMSRIDPSDVIRYDTVGESTVYATLSIITIIIVLLSLGAVSGILY